MKRWLEHDSMTNPGSQATWLSGLPTDIGALCDVVQGVLIHAECFSAYGLSEPTAGSFSRETLPVSERLRRIVEADPQPLAVPRAASARSLGTCRDFALMLCALLRHQGTAARVRCGFANYFAGRQPEDHWICEYWLPLESRWRRVDPQLDGVLKQRYAIDFDSTDVPADRFMTAGDAWLRCRTTQCDTTAFGHGEHRGLWFIRVNVVRDHYALNDTAVSSWDSWRQAEAPHRRVLESDPVATDALARMPEQPLATVIPPWLPNG